MKAALVTGSLGFIGRHMTRELVSRGYDVDGVDLDYSAPPVEPNGETCVAYDARTIFSEMCEEECCTARYDLVVHCAYHVGGRAAIDGINTNFAKNLELDAALFEWAVRTKQRRVLYFSSSAVYPVDVQNYKTTADGGDSGYRRLREQDAFDFYEGPPDANYGFAKLAGERLAEDARRNGLAVSVVRPFSGYGEDQSFDYPFPSIVRRARQGDLTVWGPPGQSRDWIHVSDVVNGALAVVDSETVAPVNLCTGVATEMGELAKQVYWAANPESSYEEPEITYDESKPTGVFYRAGDPNRMLRYYSPKINTEEGIRRALDAPQPD